MALGTVTPVGIDPHTTQPLAIAVGDIKMTVTNVVGEASYTTGGPAVTAQQLGFNSTVLAGQAEVFASTGSNCTSTAMSVTPAAGGASANLKCFLGTNVEVTSATNVSGVTWQIIAFGY